jgi:hypothetical protein
VSPERQAEQPPDAATPACAALLSQPVAARERLWELLLDTNADHQQSATTELNLHAVRRDQKPLVRRLDQLDKLYPGKSAPRAIANEYNRLLREGRRLAAREGRLVRQYNRTVDQHNEILDSDC